jgi:hypothetical protein
MRYLVLSIALIIGSLTGTAQHTGYSLKFGPSVGVQQFNNFDQGPLFGYHVDLQVENISETDPRTLYAGVGYHRRGSANRITFTTLSGGRRQSKTEFIFNNIALIAGGKQLYAVNGLQAHVSLALRGEVNVNQTNKVNDVELENNEFLLLSFPQEQFVNRFVYGIDIGAGIDFPLSPTLDGLVEIRVSPDFSRQYFQPSFIGFDPFTGNNDRVFAERRINNISFELSVGIRFIQYSEY